MKRILILSILFSSILNNVYSSEPTLVETVNFIKKMSKDWGPRSTSINDAVSLRYTGRHNSGEHKWLFSSPLVESRFDDRCKAWIYYNVHEYYRPWDDYNFMENRAKTLVKFVFDLTEVVEVSAGATYDPPLKAVIFKTTPNRVETLFGSPTVHDHNSVYQSSQGYFWFRKGTPDDIPVRTANAFKHLVKLIKNEPKCSSPF